MERTAPVRSIYQSRNGFESEALDMLFYFSATGNSKRTAEIIAERTGDRLVSISGSLADGRSTFDASSDDRIGFVIPTYFYNPPKAVMRFVEGLEIAGCEGKYAYVVLTLGTRTGTAGRTLAKALAEKGVDVVAQFCVRTQYTYIPSLDVPGDDELNVILDEADADSRKIAEQVASFENGDFNRFAGTVAAAVSPSMKAAYDKASATSNFTMSDGCDGCGVCAEVCPDRVISVEDGRPVWNADSCTLCLACLHRCPRAAIDLGESTAGKRRYTNPRTEMPVGPI